MEEDKVQLKAPYLKCSNITGVEDAWNKPAGLKKYNSLFIKNKLFLEGRY